MNATLSPPVSQATCQFRIAAVSVLRCPASGIAQRRRQVVTVGNEAMPASFLKHSEDQTVLGMWAVLDAVTASGWKDRSFADWGVVAAGNFFGRCSVAQTIARFQKEGAWGISPNLIPHQSLHATSGTISQALKIHGPNFGIGGGPKTGPDAFLLAATLLADDSLPGLWLVLTGHDAEVIPTLSGAVVDAPNCLAVALALTRETGAGSRLSIGMVDDEETSRLPEFRLSALVDECQDDAGSINHRWRLSERHWIGLESSRDASEKLG